MKIATWNVNSLRARADRVEAFLERHDIDVLAIQETKCRDENFPWELFERAGYEVVHNGTSQWNGVAIASRVGLSDVQRGFPGQPHFGKGGVDPQEESRAIGATVGAEAADGVAPVRLWSLYVPNGRGLENEHMGYKLEWLRVLQEHAAARLAEDPDTRLALAGDWNIAPQDEDVWDMAFFEGKTHVTEPERAAFQMLEETGLTQITHDDLYSFWDYKAMRFQKDEGMLNDFQLATKHLFERVEKAYVDVEEREGKGASDHAPVIVEYDTRGLAYDEVR